MTENRETYAFRWVHERKKCGHFSDLAHGLITQYICYAQTRDRDNPWIALRKPWTHALCNNPWIVCANRGTTLAQHRVRRHKLKEQDAIAQKDCDQPHKAMLGTRIQG